MRPLQLVVLGVLQRLRRQLVHFAKLLHVTGLLQALPLLLAPLQLVTVQPLASLLLQASLLLVSHQQLQWRLGLPVLRLVRAELQQLYLEQLELYR